MPHPPASGHQPARRVVAVLMAAIGALPQLVDPPTLRGDDEKPAVAIAEARKAIEKVEASLDAGRPKRAADEFKGAATAVESLLSMPKPPAGARPLQDRLRKIRDMLELEGVDVGDLTVPVAKPAAKTTAGKTPPGKKPMDPKDDQPGFTRPTNPAGPAVSFSRDVAPMIVRACGGCHISGRKGGFQVTSYDSLAKSGMVQVGVSNASRLVEVIQSGDMPRGGGKVSPHELAQLMKWIDAGAAFDGKDPSAPLESLAASAPPAAPGAAVPGKDPPKPATPNAAAKPPSGGVSFAFEVVPVLLEQCSGCHGGRRPAEGLSMGSYANLLRGGQSGSPIVPGKGNDSLLIRKLVGMRIEGQRMPLRKPPLADATTALIRRWIDEGAALDLLTPETTLDNLAAAGRAAKLPHPELRDLRFSSAGKFWSRAIPDEPGVSVRREETLVIGNLSESEIGDVADRAEAMARKLHDAYRVGKSTPLTKGGCVLCVCRKSYDYSSFWQTILGREKPTGFVNHAGIAGDVLYGAFTVPKDGLSAKEEVSAMLAEQLATAAWLARGAPDWFAVGAGKVAAAKFASKAPSVIAANNPRATPPTPPPADVFLGANIDPEERAAVAAPFVASLDGRGNLATLLNGIDAIGMEREAFQRAFANTFGGSPEAVYTAWLAGGGRGGR